MNIVICRMHHAEAARKAVQGGSPERRSDLPAEDHRFSLVLGCCVTHRS
jgi:hypothetical protein